MAPQRGPTDAPETAVDVSDPRLPQDSPASAATAPEDTPEPSVAEVAAAVRELASSAESYHARAQQREGVIDHLRSEVELLRRGERRGLLRPLLSDLCRLRDDLMRQAIGLPEDFDSERAALLLRSYAESIVLTLGSNGVVSYAPACGDPFEPRLHRRVGDEAATEPMLAGRIARVRRDGYLDIEADTPIAPAEVIVFGPDKRGSSERTAERNVRH